MDKKERLNALIRHYSNGNKADFARKIGVSPQAISTWLSRSTYDVDIIYAKCEYLSSHWLLTGNGPMLKTECTEKKISTSQQTQEACENDNKNTNSQPSLQVFEYQKSSDRIIDIQKIPIYDITATAGITSILQGGHSIPADYYVIPDAPRCDGGVAITGDSMYPILKSGDKVLYKLCYDISVITWGEIYIIDYTVDADDYTVVKYVHPGPDDQTLILVSHNEHHAPITIQRSWIRVIARVKMSIRFHTL